MRWTQTAVGVVLVASLAASLAAACGGGNLKRAGESCAASSECDPGLLCDFGSDPHVCSMMGTSVDAPVPVDAAPDDGTPGDAAVDARPDAAPIDAAPDAPIDAAVDATLDAI